MFTGLTLQDGTATDVPQSGTGSTSEGTQDDKEQDMPTADEVDTDRERAIISGRRDLSQVIHVYTLYKPSTTERWS